MRLDTRNRHRRTIRLPDYDYAQPGAYFVTVCTKDRELFFDDALFRKSAEECWSEIPRHFPHVSLDEWVVMPNHIHGIVVIREGETRRGVQLNAPTRDPDNRLSAISPSPRTLGVIIRTYKAAVTKRCRQDKRSHFAWQRNYYEHIIRNEADLERIRGYIQDNPARWDTDEENPAVWRAEQEVRA